MQEWQTAKVVAIETATYNTKSFFLEIDNTNNFKFEAGQFITLDLPIHEQKNKRWRSYSIASHPNNSNIIELVIVLLEGGLGTTYLFNKVVVGSVLSFRGPAGKFVLPETIDKNLFFICTGTGIAPFRSMLHFIKENNIVYKNLFLVFGCRTLNDCLYKDEMIDLGNQLPNFTYLPCFSREENLPNWAHKGYVHEAYITQLKKLAPNDANFYLCGWKNMVDDAKEKIIALGFDKKDIHLELYG
jgi:ferredoxin-NADP reductase